MDQVVKDLGQGAPAESVYAILADPAVDIVRVAARSFFVCTQQTLLREANPERTANGQKQVHATWVLLDMRQLPQRIVSNDRPHAVADDHDAVAPGKHLAQRHLEQLPHLFANVALLWPYSNISLRLVEVKSFGAAWAPLSQ